MRELQAIGQEASRQIDQLIADLDSYNEQVLDMLIAQEVDVSDVKLVWSVERPLGVAKDKEPVADLTNTYVFLQGPEVQDRGPTPEEREAISSGLAKGDKISSFSRPTQWVISTSRTKGLRCWALEWEPGPEDDPDAPVFTGEDGWQVWELTTASHLLREGKTLGHCVGQVQMRYAKDVASGVCKIYSVRQEGKPKITVEVRDGKVTQTQGKSGVRLKDIPEALQVWEAFRASLV